MYEFWLKQRNSNPPVWCPYQMPNTVVTGLSMIAEGENDDKHRPYQLDLFMRPELKIIQELRKLDVDQMTPLDALNRLNELHEKAKEGNST